MRKISVIFIGTGDFGLRILEMLIQDSRFSIPLVITAPDKAAGRDLAIKENAIKKVAIKNKIIIQQPRTLDGLRKEIEQVSPDFLLVVAYGEIIKKDILNLSAEAAVNIHASLLPKYRGASPIQTALLNGEWETGNTWIVMNEKMDAGDIIHQEKIAITKADDFPSLFNKLSENAALVTPDVLFNFTLKKNLRKQDKTYASYCKKIKKSDGLIDWEESAQSIVRKIKAYTPWPGCYTFLNKNLLKIFQAEVSEQKIRSKSIIVNKNCLLIGTGTNALNILTVQPAGRKKLSAAEFIRGQKEIPQFIG